MRNAILTADKDSKNNSCQLRQCSKT